MWTQSRQVSEVWCFPAVLLEGDYNSCHEFCGVSQFFQGPPSGPQRLPAPCLLVNPSRDSMRRDVLPSPRAHALIDRYFQTSSNPEVEAHAGIPPSPGSFLQLLSSPAKADGFPKAGSISSCSRHLIPTFPTQPSSRALRPCCGHGNRRSSLGSYFPWAGQDGLKPHPLCKSHRRDTHSGDGSVASSFCSCTRRDLIGARSPRQRGKGDCEHEKNLKTPQKFSNSHVGFGICCTQFAKMS